MTNTTRTEVIVTCENTPLMELLEHIGRYVQLGMETQPRKLTTTEDFENAPEGTIVARNEDYPLVKNGQGDWWDTYHNMYDEKELAGTSRKVLRWGWGERQ